MNELSNMNIWMALSAGFLSFISPCVLPLIPSYIGFITGISFDDLTKDNSRADVRKAITLNTLLFIFGFSSVFILLGATATTLGAALNKYQHILRYVGGTMVIILGIHFTGIINIGFLQVEKRVHLKNRPIGYFGAFLIGMAFAAGWTPCIGPILGSILMVAATESSIYKGILYLSAYSIGFGIPFLISALALNRFLTAYKKWRHWIPRVIVASGIILIIIGVLILTNNLSRLAMWLG